MSLISCNAVIAFESDLSIPLGKGADAQLSSQSSILGYSEEEDEEEEEEGCSGVHQQV